MKYSYIKSPKYYIIFPKEFIPDIIYTTYISHSPKLNSLHPGTTKVGKEASTLDFGRGSLHGDIAVLDPITLRFILVGDVLGVVI